MHHHIVDPLSLPTIVFLSSVFICIIFELQAPASLKPSRPLKLPLKLPSSCPQAVLTLSSKLPSRVGSQVLFEP
jgi:hypothetical protein